MRLYSNAAAIVFLASVGMGLYARPCPEIDQAAFGRLVAARNLAQLDAAAPGPTSHPGLRALYRGRRLELNPTGTEERRYLRALPRSKEEFWCMYRLTDPGPLFNTPEVGRTTYKMFDRAARLARKLGYGHDHVVQLALWSDGEVAYFAWEAFDWLLVNDPELTVAALRKVPDYERRMCKGPIDGLTVRATVARCRSER